MEHYPLDLVKYNLILKNLFWTTFQFLPKTFLFHSDRCSLKTTARNKIEF